MGPGATRATASAAVEAVLASICQAMQQENSKLHLARFGTFSRVEHQARQGYDINTATLRDIPAKSEITFKPAAQLLKKATHQHPAGLI